MNGEHHGTHLHRVRTGARATLALGIGASLAANMLAAHPSVVGRIIAAWSPVALLLTVEMLVRVPVGTGWLSGLRVAWAGVIAGIAAWVSYWHMVKVALTYGEAEAAAHLLPISVDGLVVVASVSLLEITRRLNATQPKRTAVKAPKPAPAPRPSFEVAKPEPAPDPVPVTASAPKAPVPDLPGAVRYTAAEHPDWTQAQIAEDLGCSVRTVRRHMSTTPTPAALAAVPALPDKESHG